MTTGVGFGFNELKAFVREATRICAKRQNIKDVALVKTNATTASAPQKPAEKKECKQTLYEDTMRDSPPNLKNQCLADCAAQMGMRPASASSCMQ